MVYGDRDLIDDSGCIDVMDGTGQRWFVLNMFRYSRHQEDKDAVLGAIPGRA